MTTALTAFRPRVQSMIDGVPVAQIDAAVLDSCIEFCEKSNILRYTTDPIAMAVNSFEIELDTPVDSKIVQVQRLWIGSTEIDPAQEDSVDVFSFASAIPGETYPVGIPNVFSENTAGVVRFNKKFQQISYVTARVSVKPARSAANVDDVLFENWVEGIVHGALKRLFRMEAPWKNPALSTSSAAMFKDACGDALIESRRGRNRSEDRVTPVWI